MPPALAWPALRAGNGGGICCADGTVIAVHVKLIGNQGVAHGGRIFTQPTCHQVPEVYSGLQERRGGELLKAFFRERRQEP